MTMLHALRSLSDADRRTIDEIAGALTAGWPVEVIVLYGSKARGDDTPESDIDLLVLTGRSLSPDEISGMRLAARRIGLRLGTWPELFIRTSDEWWRGVYQAAPIRKEIDAEGVDVVRDVAGGRGGPTMRHGTGLWPSRCVWPASAWMTPTRRQAEGARGWPGTGRITPVFMQPPPCLWPATAGFESIAASSRLFTRNWCPRACSLPSRRWHSTASMRSDSMPTTVTSWIFHTSRSSTRWKRQDVSSRPMQTALEQK